MPRTHNPETERPRLVDAGGDVTKYWYVQFYAPGADGQLKRRRLTVHGTTAADRYRQARLLIKQIDQALKAGAVLIPSTAPRPKGKPPRDLPTLGPGAALAAVCKEMVGTWRPATVRGCAVVPRRVTTWATARGLERLPIHHVTPAHWADFMTWLRTDYRSARTGRPLDGATWNCYLMRLKQLVAVLHKSGRYPVAAPLRGVKLATAEGQANRAYTDEQKARLLPALHEADPALGLLAELMYYSLARPAELVRLRVRHVRADVLEIPASISKTRRLRFPLITPPLRAVLDGLRLEQAAPDDFLISTGGRPGPVALDSGRLSNTHTGVVRALGLGAGFTLYSWKHSGVVDMYRAGIGERYIQQQGGWASGVHFQIYLRSLGLYAAEELTLKAPVLHRQG